jgi:hypothetical protein
MIDVPVKPSIVRKDKAVFLSKDLPPMFGNYKTIVAFPQGGMQRKGYVTSNGFENGMLRVHFPLIDGDENVQFNVLSAEQFLVCDPWI